MVTGLPVPGAVVTTCRFVRFVCLFYTKRSFFAEQDFHVVAKGMQNPNDGNVGAFDPVEDAVVLRREVAARETRRDGFWKFGTFSILMTRSPPPLNQSPLTRLKFCPPITSLFVSPAFIPAG